jgi:hypothetical protein
MPQDLLGRRQIPRGAPACGQAQPGLRGAEQAIENSLELFCRLAVMARPLKEAPLQILQARRDRDISILF